MFFKYFELLVAWRYLKSKRKDGFISVITWLSLIGIALGVATLIIVMSVMNGFREEMLSKILGMNGHISVNSAMYKKNIKDYDNIIYSMMKNPLSSSFESAPIAMIEGQLMLSSDGTAVGGMLRGIDFKDLEKVKPLISKIDKEDLEEMKDGDVLVGYQLANKLGVWVGDEITLTSPQGNVTAFGTIPRIKAYRVGAIFNTGMSIYDTGYLFMNLSDAQVFLDMEEQVSHLEIFLNNPDDAYVVAKGLANLLGASLVAYTWQSQNSSFVSALNVERNVMFLILTLIILVASFNIISSLVMLVKDKSRDIAVFKTVGATKASVMKIFFIAGSLIGVVGTFLGVGLGLLVSHNIESVRQFVQNLTGTKLFPDDVYFLTELPSQVDYTEVMWVVVMALVIAFLATLYPSRKAAKQEPIDVLRYE